MAEGRIWPFPPLPLCLDAYLHGHWAICLRWSLCRRVAMWSHSLLCHLQELLSKGIKNPKGIIKFSSCVLKLEQCGVWGVECRCSERQLTLSYSGLIVMNSNKLPFGYFPRGMFVDSVHKGSKDVHLLGKIIIQITVFF